jgi:hypothetical protein
MRETRQMTIQDLRRAIDCLPRRTRIAILQGISANPIIAGAYANTSGICPMLAAHRAGGRTDFIGFAKAWDRFAFAGVRRRKRRARPATRRELLVLKAHLEASLIEEELPIDLSGALREHQELVSRHESGARASHVPLETPEAVMRLTRPGDPNRSAELRRRPGWRWMRVVRTLDDYERTLAALAEEQASLREREALMRELELQLESS